MHCAFHPMNAATANCAGCNRPLCPNCDHRIKGYPHCEDCIVRGVDLMRRAANGSLTPAPLVMQGVKSKSRHWKATLCALVPGLGAVYNRQNFKALFHFVGVVGLAQLAAAADIELFGVGAAVFYLFTLIDANRTAKSIAAGADPREDEVRLRWMFSKHRGTWGVALLGSAALIAISSLIALPLGLRPAHLWAVVLFATGLYFISSYFRTPKESYDPGATIPPVPRSVVSTALPALGEELSIAQSQSASRQDRR
jgi:hypothetical protein